MLTAAQPPFPPPSFPLPHLTFPPGRDVAEEGGVWWCRSGEGREGGRPLSTFLIAGCLHGGKRIAAKIFLCVGDRCTEVSIFSAPRLF